MEKYNYVRLNGGEIVDQYARSLKNPSKFVIIAPKQMMNPIRRSHRDLYEYLDTRYWS